jgi:acyl-CoA hydrolase
MVFVGDLVTIRASINMAGRTSMEVGVRVEAENMITGNVRHVASAYLTFVAVNSKGRPVSVPGLIFASDIEKRRNREARKRHEVRLSMKAFEKQCQETLKC